MEYSTMVIFMVLPNTHHLIMNSTANKDELSTS